jgi:hypothetical protein
MPIRLYLDGQQFDPETIRLLGLAFEITRAVLKIDEGDEPAKAVIASKLIELAQQGERDPDRLSDRVVTLISEPPNGGPRRSVDASVPSSPSAEPLAKAG